MPAFRDTAFLYAVYKGIEDMRQKPVAIFAEGIFSPVQRPVIEDGPLIHGVDLHQFFRSTGVFKLTAF